MRLFFLVQILFLLGIQREVYSQGNNDCSTRILNNCNYILNNTFTPNILYIPADHYQDPFDPQIISLIPDWKRSHGSPNIYDGTNYPNTLPFPNSGYSRMGSGNDPLDGSNYSEGIVEKIPPLSTGSKYALSFFKKRDTFTPLNFPTDRFFIILMHCEDYNSFDPYSNSIPQYPINHQIIYCERRLENTTWEQVFISFVPNRNYDMIWIFPQQSTTNQNAGAALFSFPELISLQGFTAGPTPNTSSGQCLVTIGPTTPNCSVRNAVFTWYGPSGLAITAPQNQQIQIDASNPQNIGTWTLSMSVPSAVNPASNTCSQLLTTVSSTVEVQVCRTESWPKVYSYGRLPSSLLKDNSGNFLVKFLELDMNQSINHIGPSPIPNSGPYDVTFNYSSNGVTNWFKSQSNNGTPPLTSNPYFVLGSGDVQWSDYTYSYPNEYYSITTGNSLPGPIIVPATETIIAETTTGTFITKNATSVFVHSPSFGTTSISVTNLIYSKFNAASNKLFIATYNSLSSSYTFKIFQLSGNILNLLSSTIIQESSYVLTFAQIDDLDNVYVIRNNVLEKYNYQTNTFTPVVISNYTNSNILGFTSSNPYTENKCLVINKIENNIYFLDLSALESRKINVSNFPYPTQFPIFQTILWGYRYLVDNGFLYITGSTEANLSNHDLVIGTQTIPAIGSSFHSVFFTKFNLLIDFTNRHSNNEQALTQNASTENITIPTIGKNHKLSLIPNPTKGIIRISFSTNFSSLLTDFSVFLLANNGNRLATYTIKNGLAKSIDVSTLPPGIYYIQIVNNKEQLSIKSFIKL